MKRLAFLLGLSVFAAVPPPLFTDVTQLAGIRWTQFNGASPERMLVESTTGGVAFLDFDGDGQLDLFLVNGGETPGGRSKTPVRNALYRNLGNGKFEDVAAKAGVDRIPMFGMGAAVADYDNDGRPDIYVTGFPSSTLFHNNGDGTFRDVTAGAGVANSGEWGASAAWFDYDRDGRLDLFVANYAEFSFNDRRRCDFNGRPAYCAQTDYKGRPPRLYHNQADGTFRDVTETAGLLALTGRGLGAVAIDMDGDGWPDLFVARDASPNLLLINQKNGTFRDAAFDAEVAFNADGIARAGMGVDAGDVDGDGRPDIVVTNFDSEYHALYLNAGKFPYREATISSKLAEHTKPYVGWGVRFLDYDNDGDLDLLIVNGHLHEMISESNRSVTYRQPPLLLSNDGKGVFTNMAKSAGPAFQKGFLGRGLAIGDFDNDGAVDAAFVSLQSQPVLLRNTAAAGKNWIGVHLRGTQSNRDAIGARLTIRKAGKTLTRWINGGSSFLSGHDYRVVFGLGSGRAPADLEIAWPSGAVQQLSGLAPNRYHSITEPTTKEKAQSAISPGHSSKL
ncbi:MAG: CRTAC1 family protein [Bryobacteraceae bacterium]